MIEVFGIPISVVHGLFVELHTGVAVFAFLALVAMLLTDLSLRGKPATTSVEIIRRDADAIAYIGAIVAVFFLILSGITGYLIEPYSTMATTPLLLNKSLTALSCSLLLGCLCFRKILVWAWIVAKGRIVRACIHHLCFRDTLHNDRRFDRG